MKVPKTTTLKKEEYELDPKLDVSKWNDEVKRVVSALAAACPGSGCYFQGLR